MKIKKDFQETIKKQECINLRKLGLANKIIAVPDDTEKNINLIKKINPDVIVLGYDQNSDFLGELKKYKLKTKYYESKKFAGGIHSSLIKS